MCSDCEACGLKKHGLTRCDCICTRVAYSGYRIRVDFSILRYHRMAPNSRHLEDIIHHHVKEAVWVWSERHPM